MEMRIVVPDAAGVGALAERLTLVVGADRVSLLADHQKVDVRVEHESDRAILHVLGAVERWPVFVPVGSAGTWLGDRLRRFVRWGPVETWQ